MSVLSHTGLYFGCSLPESTLVLHGDELVAHSYRAYLWLREQSFDIVHFHALGGLGFYTLNAKAQGLFPLRTRIFVGVHAITASEMNAIDAMRSPQDPVLNLHDLVHDYIQQRSAELAVCLSALFF